jgi:integrative and conjugative element protein (TIGR02256 family)
MRGVQGRGGRGLTYSVNIAPEAERRIRQLARASADSRETGGILLGRGPDADGVIQVEEAGEPGSHAERRSDFFLRDRAHAEALAAEAWKRSRAIWVGEWHTHPTGPGTPSTRDLVTYSGLLDDSELAFDALVSVIVVPDADAAWEGSRLLVWVLESRHARVAQDAEAAG